MHVDVSHAYFHTKAQRFVLVKLLAEGCSGKDATGNEIGKIISKTVVTRWGAVQETCSTTRKEKPRV